MDAPLQSVPHAYMSLFIALIERLRHTELLSHTLDLVPGKKLMHNGKKSATVFPTTYMYACMYIRMYHKIWTSSTHQIIADRM